MLTAGGSGAQTLDRLSNRHPSTGVLDRVLPTDCDAEWLQHRRGFLVRALSAS